jgi:hypothetical protein
MKSVSIILVSLLVSFLAPGQSYIYHSYRALRQPYRILYNSKSHKEIKKIDDDTALLLATHWYDELKICQKEQTTDPIGSQNIRFLYETNDDEYKKMSDIMTFNYNIQNDEDARTEYLIWKPKVHQIAIDEDITNSVVYPCFRQSMCLVGFQRIANNVEIQDMIFNPFWNGESKLTHKHMKKVLIHYFITYMKHKRIEFNV